MELLDEVRVLWDYMCLHQPLQKADCIVAFGCYDLDVARRGAQLYLEGYAPLLVFTGGLGKVTAGLWEEPESVRFARVAREMGVPQESMLLETASTSTGENIRFTKALLQREGVAVRSIIGVQKPYMERRLLASLKKQWPEVSCTVTSQPDTLEGYLVKLQDGPAFREETIALIVGDFQRIDTYARAGYQIPQEIPPRAWQAFEALTRAGYTKYVQPHPASPV